jgi:trehalose 6-phosphate synthase
MSRTVRFLALLVFGLGLLTWVALAILQSTTRNWVEKDVSLRAELAVNGARRALVANWRSGDWREMRGLLSEVAHDERIMAVAACSPDHKVLARTAEFPNELSCRGLATETQPKSGQRPWRSEVMLASGKLHLSALPIAEDGKDYGFVLVVQDLSYAERREGTMRQILLLGFGVLAAAASLVTLIAARLSWRGWSNELRKLLRGEAHRPEFQPLLQDVRNLADRLAFEKDLDGHGGNWTPQRLKQILSRHLEGERVVIVANREPYIHEKSKEGKVSVVHPASGLVTALEPIMRACSGTWVAHGSGSADRETADRNGRVRVPPGEESYVLRRVWLQQEEERGYYYGFSNEGLWPLCHMAHNRPTFRLEDWRHYKAINQRFAEAACSEVDSEDPIILIQDYHFALAPKLIRAILPKATILTFWHIPWPNAERFGICPWRNELLDGLLGSSIVGFHTQLHCNNFIEAVDRYIEARIDREQSAVVHASRTTMVRPYPISIEWPNRWAKSAPPPEECRKSVLQELGLPPTTLLGVGVDRLDYTKGIEERLLAVERLLERFPSYRGRFTFVQLAAPSRTIIERYRLLSENVEKVATRINERFGTSQYRPVILLRAHHEPPAVFRYYRAADLCYVSSLHDGMNLVAKEFVSARDDEQGVLILSQFAGAAKELTEALIVNPYDMEEASSALMAALEMSEHEQRERMKAMRALVSEFNVYRWAGRMLVDAARVRRRERLSGRLTVGLHGIEGAA